MAKKYNYNFIRKHSQGGGTAVRLAILSGGLFVVDAVISFAFGGRRHCFVCHADVCLWILPGAEKLPGGESQSQKVGDRLRFLRSAGGTVAFSVSDRSVRKDGSGTMGPTGGFYS